MSNARLPLEYYLALRYPFHVLADPDGGYVVTFPDLPGCVTQAESLEELPALVEDARRGWIETEYQRGNPIPLPSYPEKYSGKFVVRLPRSLHHALAEAAAREGVSLNQYVATRLAETAALARVEQRLAALEARLDVLQARLAQQTTETPAPSSRRRARPLTPASPGR